MTKQRKDLNVEEKFEYVFRDLYITAFLLCKGGKMIQTKADKKNSKVKVFTLSFDYEIENLLQDYYNELATVNPKQYKNKIQDLKGIINRDTL